jgi:hypothetical protein
VGALTFSWDELHQFSAREETLYNTLSGLASPTVESRQLLAQAEARAAREQTLREVAERIRGAADVDTVMRAAALEVGRLLDRETFIYLADKNTQ